MGQENVGRYVVSTDPDDLFPGNTVDDSMPTYATKQEAIDSILNGAHGEIGTRYVLKLDLEVVAVAERPWTLVHS